ncbi:lipoxygenase 3, chloroplastic [Lactuca sativa]|uniref:lipoxygenase 3, chloroplastic n=1 Tax=Lactuca sativa TaxID=4236 RepID=UPI000CC475AE|nr:lipoxygenase 3, chloroplastic [Lactuca sativa]
MSGTINMFTSFSLSYKRTNTTNIDPIYPISHYSISSCTISNVPLLVSSCKKLKSGCTLKFVKASLATEDFIEEVNVDDVSSRLKVTATVNVRISKEVNVFKKLTELPQKDSSYEGFVFQLVSTQVDPSSMKPKVSKESALDWSKCTSLKDKGRGCFSFKVKLVIDEDFGEPGAILVRNHYDNELFVETISIEDCFHFSCNSWIQPAHTSKEKRIFFSNKAYLPSQTPKGMKYLRDRELKNKRGDGKGQRLLVDRIYDYDTYNDLGNPDKGVEFTRSTLGGEKNPHPRRCRTGRPNTATDVNVEKPVNLLISSTYVPRDEALEGTRRKDIFMGVWKGVLHNIPAMVTTLFNRNEVSIDISNLATGLYRNVSQAESLNAYGLFKFLDIKEMLKFETPKTVSWNITSYVRDDEFGRQTLAGMNPVSIERLKVFPPVSKLDPSMHGPRESNLKEEHIICHLNGMSVQQALDEKKLFILDYHDIYLPFLDRINAQEGRKAYGTRTIFFLTTAGTLKPIAIELSLPPNDSNLPSKQVLTPPVDATTNWLWQLGKAHVCSNDAGVHQLFHHWLRVHACMEPFIIAAHRHLSSMHPVFKLLNPHMRHLLGINSMARESLISAEGIIESGFSSGRYSTHMVCAAYRNWWRFDLEGLPQDLIRRGMAVPDETRPHGLKLLIEDYPYANDGLLIWSAIQELVHTYVNYYYHDDNVVIYDTELQSWYSEAINVGHADVREASWWPKLCTTGKLTEILTIIIWISSAQHAALNFGQYHYGGYVPNRPPLMQKLIPKEHELEYASFIADPHGYFVDSLPSLFQTTKYMAVLDIISAHSQEEEYLGEIKDMFTSWPGEPKIIEAFYKFSMEIRKIENEIKRRNLDPKLRNRCGAGIPPYELLVPTSEPGVTGRGIPNSISI